MECPALPASAVCAGLSARWLAEALAARGVVVHALDRFGDSDTRAAAAQWLPLGDVGSGCPAGGRAHIAAGLPEAAPLWYVAGFEGAPHRLERLAHGRLLVGNAPGLLARASTPSAWLKALATCGLPAPETRLPPWPEGRPPGGCWLVKQGGASGGGHVGPWSATGRLPEGAYLQRYVKGHSLGVTFLADGKGARVIGVARHFRLQRALSGDFAQGAMVGCGSLGMELHARFEAGLARLSRYWGLVGVNGVDVIASPDGRLWWLELNARLPGSLALAPAGHPWVTWHWQLAGPSRCSLDRLAPALPPAAVADAAGVSLPLPFVPPQAGADPPLRAPARVRAQSLFRAPSAAVIPPDPAWPDWVHDRPMAGSRIAAGEAFATITAEESSAREALLTLRRRMNILAAHPAFSRGGAPQR